MIVPLKPDTYALSTPSTNSAGILPLISLAPASRTKAGFNPAAVTAKRLRRMFWNAVCAAEIPKAPPNVWMTVYGVRNKIQHLDDGIALTKKRGCCQRYVGFLGRGLDKHDRDLETDTNTQSCEDLKKDISKGIKVAKGNCTYLVANPNSTRRIDVKSVN